MHVLTSADGRRALIARHPWSFIASAGAAGVLLGAIARFWMRWISVDPEFSWGGTLAIVSGFAVFALAQASAAVVRIRSSDRTKTTVLRVMAGVLSGGLFGAAGAVMLPTVVFGSVAAWRTGLRPSVRALLCLLAVPSIVFVALGIVDDRGWSLETMIQLLVFVAMYAAIVAGTWPTAAPFDDALPAKA